MYEKLLALEGAKVDFNSSAILTLNIAIGLIMVGVALGIKLTNFKKVFQNPKSFILGVLSQFVALPLVTFLLVITLPIPASVALGMILVAACPGGNISNFMSSYSKSNVELSVSLTMFSTLAAWIITPLNFAFYGNWFLHISERRHTFLVPIEIDFMQMLQTITLILVIPLIAGLLIQYFFSNFADKAGPYVRRISMMVFVTIVSIAIYRNAGQIVAYLHIVFLLVLLHSILGYGSGYLIGRSFKLSQIDTRTITLETGIQNAGLAMALVFNPKLFGGDGGMAAVTSWWGVWSILSGLIVAIIFSLNKLKKE
jgi:BASS family bile acid:Na+ symporter